MFSSRDFIVSGLKFRFLIHFEFIFVYGVKKCSNFIILQVVDQFSQHRLLKRLSFFHCIFLCGEQGTLLHCWWECKLVQPLWRTVWRFLKKLEIELPYDPAIPLLGVNTKETRTERSTCTSMFIAALFIIARTRKHGSNLDAHKQMNG